MRHLSFLTFLAGAVILGLSSYDVGASDRQRNQLKKPNIIVIMADDWGKDAASLYNPTTDESENAPTPSLDALADEGILFTQAWAMPACTPTRGTRTLGKLPSTSGIGFPLGPLTPRFGTPGPFEDVEFPPSMIDPSDPDLIQRLAQHAGYRTYKLGKSHETETDPIFQLIQCPPQDNIDIDEVIAQGVEDIINSGFHKFYGQVPGGPHTRPCDPNNGYGGTNTGPWTPHNNLGLGLTTEFLSSALVSQAIEFMKEAKEYGKPYYISLDFPSPHFRYEVAPGPDEPAPVENQNDWRTLNMTDHASVIAQVKAAFGGVYPDAGTGYDILNPDPAKIRAAFKSLVSYMDVQIGRLMEHVDLKNTFVFFAGDNGTQGLFFGSPIYDVIEAPYDPARSKGTLYRNGVEVPFIVAGPRIAGKGGTSDALVTTTDIYATVLNLMRVPQPVETYDDSFSFLKVLQGRARSARRVNVAEVFATGPTVGGTATGPYADEGRVVADKRFRLLSKPVIDDNGTPAFPFDDLFVCREDSFQLPEDECFNPQTAIYEKETYLEFYDLEEDPFENNALTVAEMTRKQFAAFSRLCGEMNKISSRATYYMNGIVCEPDGSNLVD